MFILQNFPDLCAAPMKQFTKNPHSYTSSISLGLTQILAERASTSSEEAIFVTIHPGTSSERTTSIPKEKEPNQIAPF